MTELATIIFPNGQWRWPALALFAVAAALIYWSNLRGPARAWTGGLCGALKLMGVTLLLLALLEPMQISQRVRPGANVFAVIADNSRSLQLKDDDAGTSRGEALRRLLSGGGNHWQTLLEKDFQVRRYSFASRLENSRDFSELNFEGRSSALGQALTTALDQWRGQPVAGVLLFSDGNATDLGEDPPDLKGCPPIYPVMLGAEKSPADISVKTVGASQSAFEDAPVTIQARASADGFAGKEITARLTETARVRFSPGTNSSGMQFFTTSNPPVQLSQRAVGGADLDWRFQIQPDGAGLHFYDLEIRTREETTNAGTATAEATLVNNRRQMVVDRGQEPLRVLYVGGRPNWEYKFLNRAIQVDSQVQMVSLIRVARREPKFDFKGLPGESSNPIFRGFENKGEDAARYDQPVVIRLNTRDELELRGGFPRTAEELFQYQAVIIADAEAGFFTHEQQALLARFVSERGGGFLMLGGAESFREGDYAGTPVASLLPVYVDRPTESSLPRLLKLNLTREGWLQPWTRLRATEAEERNRLETLPAFEVLNASHDLKPGASVLATVSDPADHVYPALVVQRFGQGRSAALMIGDLWRWGMRDDSARKDLEKSWRQLVRWLVSDVPPRFSMAAETPADGGEVRLKVKARDESFKPLDNAAVQILVRRIGAGGEAASPADGIRLTAEAAADSGTYEATFVAREAGAFTAEAIITDANGKWAGRAVAGWAADPAAAEFQRLKPNRRLLEALARQTGGALVTPAELDSLVRQLPQQPAPLTETNVEPFWSKPVVFLLVLGLFVLEWGLRRWKGLP
ncbi:MAG: hypothetical protein U1F65_03535 [Verrucomicrobiota bacterium]